MPMKNHQLNTNTHQCINYAHVHTGVLITHIHICTEEAGVKFHTNFDNFDS